MLTFSYDTITTSIDLMENDKFLFAFSPNFSIYFKNVLMKDKGEAILKLFDEDYYRVRAHSGYSMPKEYLDIIEEYRLLKK